MGKQCKFPPLFSRNKKIKRRPKHFTFDTIDIYKSNLSPQTKQSFPHWSKYPLRTHRIINATDLTVRLMRKAFINRWVHNFYF